MKIAGKDPNGNVKGVAVTENGEVKVQQTGSIVEEIVIPREIRNGESPRYGRIPPEGAIGCIIEHRIYGITGTFANDEGARLQLAFMRTWGDTTIGPWGFVYTDWGVNLSSTIQQAIIMYPGINANMIEPRGGSIILAMKPISPIRLTIQIKGQFEEGEGFDSEVSIRWLLGGA